MMTREQLAAIKERLEKATPGPWIWCLGSGSLVGTGVLALESDTLICDCQPDEWLQKGLEKRRDHRPDMEFIAAAPEDIAALIAEVERKRDFSWHLRRRLAGETARQILSDFRKRQELGLSVDSDNHNWFLDICDRIDKAFTAIAKAEISNG